MAAFLLRRVYHRPQGRISIDKLKLRIPIIGKIALKTEISRLTRTLSLLISSGIPVLHALDISISVLENQVLKSEVGKFKDQIAAGSSLSKCLSGSKLFPLLVTNIVTVGEETGTLEKSLMRIADNYEKEVDRSLKSFTQLLEPFIILVMGLIVGFIVLSMLLPIFQINLIVK
jgi:type II secretory pathway component PulF